MEKKVFQSGIIILLLSFFFIFNLSCSKIIFKNNLPVLEKGVLDLRNRDLNKYGVFKIHGEWEFYWNQFIEPGKDIKPGNLIYIKDSRGWLSYKKIYKNIEKNGYATYRCIIKLDEEYNNKMLGIIIPEIWSSYCIIINENCYYHGFPGINLKTTIPKPGRKTIYFTPGSDELDLVLHVSNFHDINGGITSKLLLGNSANINSYNIRSYAPDVFLFSCIISISFLFFCLFLLNKKDLSAFFFCVFCFIVACRIIILGIDEKSIFYILIPGFDWELSRKLINLTMSLSFPFFLFFSYEHYPDKFHKLVLKITIIVSIILSVFFIIFPMRYNRITVNVSQTVLILVIIYILFNLLRCIVSKKDNSILFFIGTVIILIFSANDVLHQKHIIDTGYLAPFGLFIFILIYSFILADKNARLFFKSEKMSEELRDYSLILEEKVKDRTARLEKVNREKTDLFINLAHETKTPLNIIQLELDEYLNENKKNSRIIKIYENVNKLTGDMLNYLDSQKLESGNTIYDHSKIIDFSEILEAKINVFKEIFAKNNFKLNVEIIKPVFIKADSIAIERILNNLLDNACKYTDNPGIIDINLNIYRKFMIFKITNTGNIILPEKQKHIFEPYYQVSGKKKNNQGVGLGLYIVKKILDSIGGSITFDTVNQNANCFTVKIRIIEKKTQYKNIKIEYDPGNCSGEKIRELKDSEYAEDRDNVLIIEDNKDLIKIIINKLSNEYNVFYATNGEMALDKLKYIPKPDVIVSDIMMDKMDGWEFLEIIMSRKEYDFIPFIFITARSLNHEKIKALSLGVIDYISKPFKIEELIFKIRSILRQKNKIRKNEIFKAISILENEINVNHNDKWDIFINNCNKYSLSPAEKSIARLYVQGDEYKVIAFKLNKATSTVDTHIRNIKVKTKTHTRADLINLLMN